MDAALPGGGGTYLWCGVQRNRQIILEQGVKLIFTGSHISFEVAFKGLNIILGLYKCNYPLTVKRELGTTPVETRCQAG